MPYKPTGKPPGRPRKQVDDVVAPVEQEPAKTLTRARAGFRRAFENPADGLWHPPRSRKHRHVGKKPILHPNVIKG